jgi:tetratricopeptide (TPR) repeat protein
MMSRPEDLYTEGRNAIKKGKTLDALALLEKAYSLEPDNPKVQSALGLCLAFERGTMKDALQLCEKALQSEPENSDHYFHLGKVYLKANEKKMALETFRKGLKIDDKNPDIIAEIQFFGMRGKPIIAYFSRENILNKYLGIILRRLGLK